MTSLKLWVTILASTAFLAGLACGPFVTAWFVPPPRAASGSFGDYERLLVRTFELDPERREPLRAILAQYKRDTESIKDRHMADYMSAMEPELLELGRACRGEIRDTVLPQEQRAAFDRLVAGLPANPSPR